MSWVSKLRNAFDSKRLDREIAEEIEDHLARRADEYAGGALSEAEARQKAAVRFGNRTRLWEMTREARLWSTAESVGADVRYAWRGMRKSLGFTLTAVLSLGLAIGANTAIYSIVDAALLRPLPVAHPEQLVLLAKPEIGPPGRPSDEEGKSFSYPICQQFRAAARGTARLALASEPIFVEIQDAAQGFPQKIMQQWVSGDAFDILETGPATLGRLLTGDDDRAPGGAPYAVLSYAYWQQHYAGDPHVLGKSIHFPAMPFAGAASFQIVGVAPKRFFGIEPGRMVDVWLPAVMYSKEALAGLHWNFLRIMGRLAPGSTARRLQEVLQPTFHSYNLQMAGSIAGMPDSVRKQFSNLELRVHAASTGLSQFRVVFARPLWILLGVAMGILLIACANVASLLLARSAVRSPEMAMRLSLGAGRARLIRQLLTESVLLSVMAGAVGWLLAQVVAPTLIRAVSTKEEPVRLVLALDTRVLLFCALVCGVSTLLFGLLPAWQSARVAPMQVLRRASGQAGKMRLGHFFVGVQVAFAFCLVMAGASFLFTLRNLLAVHTGFEARGVTVVSMADHAATDAASLALMNELAGRLSTSSGIAGVALAPWPLFTGAGWDARVVLPGKGPSERQETFYNISPGFLTTLRIPLVDGRNFGRLDDTNREPIPTIVNRAFERRYFGAGKALGGSFKAPQGDKLAEHRIVGVAADATFGDLRKPADPVVYLPVVGANDFVVYVRSALPAGTVAHLSGRIAKDLGSDLHVTELTTLDELVGDTILQEKLLAGLGGAFAVLGLALAAIGLFGLLNYSVVRRTKELGIRGALGAQRSELIGLVFRDLFGMVAGGLLAGLAGSLMLMLGVRSLLFGVSAVDPLVISTAVGVFLAAAVMAGGMPALRAASVDPMTALRQE